MTIRLRQRSGFHLTLTLSALALLAGCRSSSPSPSLAPDQKTPPASSRPQNIAAQMQSVPPVASDGRPVLVAFGDSLTAGHGAPQGASYPDFLQKDLSQLGYNYRVVNAGISGDTTKDGVDRLPDVLALHPQVAIVAFGGNDGLRGLPLTNTEKNLDEILTTLTQAHVKVVLGGISLPPNYGSDYISQFDSIYKSAAKRYKLPLLAFMLKGVYGVPGSMQADGMHPTASGNEQVAKNMLPLVRPLLKKDSKQVSKP